jgi:hypothetical protein
MKEGERVSMKKSMFYALSMVLLALMMTSTFAIFRVHSAPPPWTGYVKPSFTDYAPSGMPDFDEKQDMWGPAQGLYTWCVPVAVADSLWWLDSEYESIYCASPVPPPYISDHFGLVTAYNQWDDHDPANVDPLVRNLAFLMDTDGQRTGVPHLGTRWIDVQPGIQAYLVQQGVTGSFEVHGLDFPNFNWINTEVQKCQDVELFLEFYYFYGQGWEPITYPQFESGHCVAVAGSDNTTNPGQVLISDPWMDAYESGLVPGRSPVPHVHMPPGNTATHNDAQYVSQDAYNVVPYVFPMNPLPPPPYLAPNGYPPTVWELQGYMQTLGFPDPNWHAFIRGAVATSPLPDIAVTNITTSKTGCLPFPSASLNYTVTVNVTVANHCAIYESDVNVTAYADPSMPPSLVIGSQNVSLNAGSSASVTFTWNLSSSLGVFYGNYTLRAYAAIVPGETNTADNTFTDGKILVTIPGDINGDLKCALADLSLLAKCFNTRPGDQKWNPNADFNNNGQVALAELSIMAKHFNEHYP